MFYLVANLSLSALSSFVALAARQNGEQDKLRAGHSPEGFLLITLTHNSAYFAN